MSSGNTFLGIPVVVSHLLKLTGRLKALLVLLPKTALSRRITSRGKLTSSEFTRLSSFLRGCSCDSMYQRDHAPGLHARASPPGICRAQRLLACPQRLNPARKSMNKPILYGKEYSLMLRAQAGDSMQIRKEALCSYMIRSRSIGELHMCVYAVLWTCNRLG